MTSAYTTITVSSTTLSPGTISGITTVVCAGSPIILSDGATGGIWSSGNAGIATVNSSGIVGGVSSGTVNISYSVTNGCGTASTYSVVTVNPLPLAGTIGGPDTVCGGSVITLTDASGSGVWSSSNTSIATVDAFGVVSGITSGTFNISYTVTNGCGTLATYSVVTVSTTLPSVGTISGMTNVCAGSADTLYDGASGGVWSSSVPGVATVNASGTVNGVTSGTANISYTVTGCGTVSTYSVVTVSPVPSAITGATSVCVGLTTHLSNTVAGGSWSSGSTTVATVVSGTGVVTGVSAGSATISYALSTDCYATIEVTVDTCTSGIPAINKREQIEIYPNPATNQLMIAATGNITSVRIVNLVGQTVYAGQYNMERKVQITIANLPSGIYLVKVNDSYVKRFVKE